MENSILKNLTCGTFARDRSHIHILIIYTDIIDIISICKNLPHKKHDPIFKKFDEIMKTF